MSDETKNNIGMIENNLAEMWKGLLITTGLITGIFEIMSTDKPHTIKEIAEKKNFDLYKLGKWFDFMEEIKVFSREKDEYYLTSLGTLLTINSPAKELFGFLQVNSYFLNAVLNANNTFKANQSLDRLTEGKISRNYQPRVSDNFSSVLFDNLKQYKLEPKDTLLDVGCGNASFLRSMVGKYPDIKFTGIDVNFFSIELGKQENKNMGVSEKITLLAGDFTEDFDFFLDKSFDWVTAINIFHFMKPEKRMKTIEKMARMARKGFFITPTVIQDMMGFTALPLMTLLFDDFTGFYKKEELEALYAELESKFKNDFKIMITQIMLGKNNLVAFIRK